MGGVEQNLARQAMRARQPLPTRIANAPRLHIGLELYLEAFFELDSERQQGFGPSRIAASAIRSYAAVNDFDEVQTATLHYCIGQMDAAHLKRMDSIREAKSKQ